MRGGVAYGEMVFERWKRSRLLGVVACLSLITLLNVSFSWWSNRPNPFSDSSSLDTLAAAKRLRMSLSIAAAVNASSDPQVKDTHSVVEAFSNSTAVLRREIRRKGNGYDPAAEDSVYELRYGEPLRRRGTPKKEATLESSQKSGGWTAQTVEPPTEPARNNAWGKRGESSTFIRNPTEDNWMDTTMDHKRLANSLENDTSKPQNSRPEWTKQANRTCEWSMKRNTSNSNHLRQSNRLTEETVTAPSSCHQGYLLSLDYDQQIMASFKAFYHLAVFASLFNLSIVEPYFHGKGRLGVPLVNTGAPSFLKLTDFYDRHQLEGALKSCADMDLVSFEEFAENTSPVVTFVSFLPSIEGYESYFSGEEKIVEIHNNLQNIDDGLKKLNSWTSFTRRNLEQNFTWSRIILIDARPLYPISLLHIQQKLGSIIHRQVEQFGTATVVLDNWRDIGGHSSYFYWIQGFNRRICKEMLTTAHSNTVVNAASNFATMLNLTRPVIGVHIRGEKLIIYSKNSHSHYKHCLQQLRDLLEGVVNTSKGSVVLFHDLGKYGSNSCHHYNVCRTKRPNFISEIEEFEYRVASYDPSGFRPALLQGVFAAFVEKEFLSSVDILVTVGLGNYQQSIVDRFLDRTGTSVSDNLHRLCFSKHS